MILDNFRVTKSDADSATLMPLNRQRNLAELNGQTVTFLEFGNAYSCFDWLMLVMAVCC